MFLFGPRQTGKTTWLKALFPHAPVFNLLRGEVFLRLSREPGRLRQELATVSRSRAPVIIDEIQKLPSLLDEVHDLIESRGLQFVLAASSPAKLRRGGVNLLGGRARIRRLFPFVSAEVPNWDLMRAINVGGVPIDLLLRRPGRRSASLLRQLPATGDPGGGIGARGWSGSRAF